jgi:hypothetical protein
VPGFKGSVGILGHSLGGVIAYDLLRHQHHEAHATVSAYQYPKLSFSPHHFFAIGFNLFISVLISRSPIAAVMVMRGQCFEDYRLPDSLFFHNIFHRAHLINIYGTD